MRYSSLDISFVQFIILNLFLFVGCCFTCLNIIDNKTIDPQNVFAEVLSIVWLYMIISMLIMVIQVLILRKSNDDD